MGPGKCLVTFEITIVGLPCSAFLNSHRFEMKLKLFSSCTSTDNHQLDSFKRHYSIQSRLGKGTFGDVFCAQSTNSKTKVAVKVVINVQTQEKVIYEGRLSGHTNIVRFADNDLISDKHVLVTKFLRVTSTCSTTSRNTAH